MRGDRSGVLAVVPGADPLFSAPRFCGKGNLLETLVSVLQQPSIIRDELKFERLTEIDFFRSIVHNREILDAF